MSKSPATTPKASQQLLSSFLESQPYSTVYAMKAANLVRTIGHEAASISLGIDLKTLEKWLAVAAIASFGVQHKYPKLIPKSIQTLPSAALTLPKKIAGKTPGIKLSKPSQTPSLFEQLRNTAYLFVTHPIISRSVTVGTSLLLHSLSSADSDQCSEWESPANQFMLNTLMGIISLRAAGEFSQRYSAHIHDRVTKPAMSYASKAVLDWKLWWQDSDEYYYQQACDYLDKDNFDQAAIAYAKIKPPKQIEVAGHGVASKAVCAKYKITSVEDLSKQAFYTLPADRKKLAPELQRYVASIIGPLTMHYARGLFYFRQDSYAKAAELFKLAPEPSSEILSKFKFNSLQNLFDRYKQIDSAVFNSYPIQIRMIVNARLQLRLCEFELAIQSLTNLDEELEINSIQENLDAIILDLSCLDKSGEFTAEKLRDKAIAAKKARKPAEAFCLYYMASKLMGPNNESDSTAKSYYYRCQFNCGAMLLKLISEDTSDLIKDKLELSALTYFSFVANNAGDIKTKDGSAKLLAEFAQKQVDELSNLPASPSCKL